MSHLLEPDERPCGLDRWRNKDLDLRMSLTGNLFRIKGYPEGCQTFDAYRHAHVALTHHLDGRRHGLDISFGSGLDHGWRA